MATTTLVQFSLQIPISKQVEHKPFSLPLRSLSASTAIHRSTYASNFVIRTPQIPRLGIRSRVLSCMATLKPHGTTTTTSTVSSNSTSVSMALAVAAVISGSILRAAQVMAERISFARISPSFLQELAALQNIKGSELLCQSGPLFFAVVTSSSGRVVHTPLTVVAAGIVKWLELYSGVLTVRIMLSWFPNIPWDRQPLSAIRDMCDPYLNLFRNIIPPIRNALDVSPILAFMVIGTLMSILRGGVGYGT